MPRPLWKGAINFGMVTIPIKLYTATEEKDVRFNMLHKTDMSRIKQKRFCAEEDIELEQSDIVKGYEISPGSYVVMEEEDFEKVNVPSTRIIEIDSFVSLEQIDPIYYQKTYYLEPEQIGAKPFALLIQALEESQRVAIAKVTLRQKEQICTLRVYQNVLALETMYYADEVRSTEELATSDAEVSDGDLAMARMLIDARTNTDFKLEDYKDSYREALLEIIEKKSEGQVIETPKQPKAKITDLTEALRASVEAARRSKASAGREEAPAEEEEAPKRRRKSA